MLSSFKSFAKGIIVLSILTVVANPFLNRLLAPEEEKSTTISRPPTPFDPTITDVVNYNGLNFLKRGEHMELSMGLAYIFLQVMPRWVIALLEMANPTSIGGNVTETAETTIYDARKAKDIDFKDSGFTLIDMKDDIETIQSVSDWRSYNNQGIQDFQKKLEVHLLKLLPHASRIEFTSHVIRGGHTFGDQPAAIDGPHLDYTQNDTAREQFHKEYPVNSLVKEHLALMGKWDTEEEEVTSLLGIWKPVLMSNPVCDHPLAVMDARTFSPQDEDLYPLHINFGVFVFHNLNGAIQHHPDQKLYYYPFQTETEVVVFHQYSKGRFFANPHTSFVNSNCPEGYESRVSVEMRAAVFEKRKKK